MTGLHDKSSPLHSGHSVVFADLIIKCWQGEVWGSSLQTLVTH